MLIGRRVGRNSYRFVYKIYSLRASYIYKVSLMQLRVFYLIFGEKLLKARLTVHREPIRQRPYRTETLRCLKRIA